MDPMGHVRQMINQYFGPTVLIQTSDDAQDVCKKNGLRLEQLLQPFSQTQYESTSGSQRPRKSPHIHLRFVTLQDLRRPAIHEAQKATHEVVADCQLHDFTSDIEAAMKGDFHHFATPWYDAYREMFFKLIRPSDHEYINHPVACISAVSSSHPDPLLGFHRLYNPSQPPREFKSGAPLDSGIFHYRLLIHDASGPVKLEKANTTLQQMRSKFGHAACHLLIINSRTATDAQVHDLWSNVVGIDAFNPSDAIDPLANDEEVLLSRDPSAAPTPEANSPSNFNDPLSDDFSDPLRPLAAAAEAEAEENISPKKTKIAYGASLTDDDLSRLRILLVEFTNHGLVPFLEECITRLSGVVASHRKGLSRSLFSATKKWFGGSRNSSPATSASSSPVGSPARGPFTSNMTPEQQMRRLADFYFILQDYDNAYTMYHSVKKDFNSDKNWKNFAGAQEMTGLSLIMQESTRSDRNKYFESAISTYLTKCRASLYATRMTLLYAEMLRANNALTDAANTLLRMTSEESALRSGLLLEQAALCYLERGRFERRASFHLILAGNRFYKAAQRKHAVRCYMTAMRMYRNKGWQLAEDHVFFTTGRQILQLGNKEQALKAFETLFHNERQLPSQEEIYLKEYLAVFQEARNPQPLLDLDDGNSKPELSQFSIPKIDQTSIQVFLRTPSSALGESESNVAPDFTEDKWLVLEDQLLSICRKGKSRVTSGSAHCFNNVTNNTTAPIAVVGEPIRVQFDIINPLQTSLVLTHVRLLCSHQSTQKEEELSNNDPFNVDEIEELTLGPRQCRSIVLQVTTASPGSLSIDGISFELDGAAKGSLPFEVKGKRLNDSRQTRTSVAYSKDLRLQPVITPPQPLLSASILNLQDTLVRGEIQKGNLLITNEGSSRVVNLYVCISCPEAIRFGEVESSAGQEPLSFSYLDSKDPPARRVEPKKNDQAHVRKLNLVNGALEPGQTITIPTFVLYDKAGSCDLHMIFFYEPESPVDTLPYRLLRHSTCLHVVEGVTMSANFVPFPHQLDQSLLSLDITNTCENPVSIEQLTCVGDSWSAHSVSAKTDSKIPPGASISLHFRLRRCAKDSEKEGSFVASDILLNSESSIVDILASPCADFELAACPKQTPSSSIDMNLLNLVLFWKMGQHQGQIRSFLKMPKAGNEPPESSHTVDNIQFVLNHEDEIQHDFTENPFLIVPVTLSLRLNDLEANDTMVSIELLPPWKRTESAGSIHSPFMWRGKTLLKVTLPAGKIHNIPLEICLCSGGIFDVNRLRISIPGRQYATAAKNNPWHSMLTVTPL